MKSRLSMSSLLVGVAFASPAFAQSQPTSSTEPVVTQPASSPPAQTQTAQPQTPAASSPPSASAAPADTTDVTDDEGDAAPEEIVVVGSRPRGSVIGDIPPENTLDARDVRATGATSINELLDALAPQIGSAQGRGGEQPVFLLNGQRISSFRELRDIPTEAIERVDIMPEEVALKYGYSANQKVVNFVLRQRFRSTTAQVGVSTATDGGYSSANGDLTRLLISKSGRTTINLHATGNGMLRESERNITLDQTQLVDGSTADQDLAARSLLGTKRDLRAGTTFNRTIFGDVSATLNTELEHNDGRSLIGLSDDLIEALARKTTADSAHAGVALNGTKSDWRWSFTGNTDFEHDTTRTDADAGNQRAHENTASADFMATANGNLFKVPAGDATTTLRIGGSTSHLSSESDLATAGHSSLGRTSGTAAINIDLPISRRGRDFSALGNLTLNANAEIQQLSDFGTLTKFGAGANFSPVDRLNFIGSWSREEGAPTIQQLGDPVLTTPNTRIFDFTNGQSVLVTSITGGNPNLKSDRRTVLKLGTNWQPWEKTDLRLRADFVHQTITRPISNITVTQSIEQAFPDRFTRIPCSESDDPQCDPATGELTQVDLRPVNFDRSERDTLRIGFDFSHPLKSHKPSQAVMDEMRAQLRRQFGGGPVGLAGGPASSTTNNGQKPAAANGASPPANGAPPPEGAAPPPGNRSGPGSPGGFRGGGRGGRGGGFFGGGNRGRVQFSLTDTVTFVDKVSIAPGVPELDYLHGGAAGQTGGTPRHSVEAQLGYFNNGLGARLGANWRSSTTVTSLTGDNLHFSPLATFNLSVFANPGDIPELAVKHPWLRGTQVRFQVSNLFNTRPNVRDANGAIPNSYQPELLDPLGRTVMFSIRKLFLPSPSFFRRQFQQRQQEQGTTSR